jgi:uncharacterized membrane protein
MLLVFTVTGFGGAAMVTSSLAYTPRAWWYALAGTILCALAAVAALAEALHAIVRYFSGEISHGLLVVAAAIPFCLALAGLCRRRRHTPRHTPGPEDDPLYRRYHEERLRRFRLRRQREEAIDESADPI